MFVQCSDSPGVFGDAGIVQDLHGGGGAEGLPILQHPDDFLVRGDFNELRAFAIVAAGGEDGVAVGQPGAGLRRVGEPICLRQIGVLEFPDRLALGIDFAREAVRFIGDQRVAVLEPEGGPRRADGVAPDFVKILVVFHDVAHAEEGNEIGSLRGVARAAECAVDVLGVERLAVHGQFMFNLDGAGLDVDDHELGRQAVQDEHHLVQSNGLAGVDFRVVGAGAVVAIVAPHHFFVRRDFGEYCIRVKRMLPLESIHTSSYS